MNNPFALALIEQAAETLEQTARRLEAKLIPGQDKANFDDILQIAEARRAAESLRTLLED